MKNLNVEFWPHFRSKFNIKIKIQLLFGLISTLRNDPRTLFNGDQNSALHLHAMQKKSIGYMSIMQVTKCIHVFFLTILYTSTKVLKNTFLNCNYNQFSNATKYTLTCMWVVKGYFRATFSAFSIFNYSYSGVMTLNQPIRLEHTGK